MTDDLEPRENALDDPAHLVEAVDLPAQATGHVEDEDDPDADDGEPEAEGEDA